MYTDWLPLSARVWAVQQVIFHATALAFEYCDRTGTLRHLKLRDVDRHKKPYARLLPCVLFNQCFVLLPCMVWAELAGFCYKDPRTLTPQRVLVTIVVMAFGHEVVQYITHRLLLHCPNIWMMRLFRHWVHHSTGASIGISACYMTATDFLLEIVIPYLAPLALVGGGGSNLLFHGVISGLGALGGVYEHSGYDFAELLPEPPAPLMAKGEVDGGSAQDEHDGSQQVRRILRALLTSHAHAEHHSRGKVSFADGFGSPGICDTVFGTRWDLVPTAREAAEKEWQAQRAHLADITEEKDSDTGMTD